MQTLPGAHFIRHDVLGQFVVLLTSHRVVSSALASFQLSPFSDFH